MVSMKDIAKECGVSVATVSKALSGQPDIGDDTRERIAAAAEKMGYLANSAARALKTNRTFNLGVLFVDEGSRGLTHEYFAAVLNSFKTEAERKGYDITFISGSGRVDRRTVSCLQHCLYRGVDGLLIACMDFYDRQVSELISSSLPVVTIDHIFKSRPAVLSDNFDGEKALFNYAWSLGHRKIAFIKGEKSSAVTASRLEGFMSGAAEAGFDVPQDYILQGQFYEPDVSYRLTVKLLNQPDRPTCILYPDDFSLVGGVKAINDMGLTVPGDISVAGYDGIIVSQVMTPAMTTYAQNTDELGRMAADRLIQLIENPKELSPAITHVTGRLIEGGSIRSI